MSAPTPSYAAPPMASAPTQRPRAAVCRQPARPLPRPPARHLRRPAGQYGSPAPTAAGPPRRSRRARSPRPRRRGRAAAGPAPSSACSRSASRSSGIGLGAALDDPLGFPGSSATLGFLIALTGVSLVVLALGLRGRASGFSGFLVVDPRPAARGLVGRLAGRRAGRRRRPHLDPGARRRARRATSSARVTPPSTSAGSTPTSPRTSPQVITVEMGAGEPHDPRARGPRRPGRRQRRHRQHPPPGGIAPAPPSPPARDRSTSTIIGERARAGRRRRRARPRPDHHPGAVMSTPTTPPTPDTPTPDDPATPDEDTRSRPTPAGRRQPGRRGLRRRRPHRGPADDRAPAPTGARGATATATAPVDGIAPRPGTGHGAEPTDRPEPQWLSGPAPFAIVLGLLGLLVAGARAPHRAHRPDPALGRPRAVERRRRRPGRRSSSGRSGCASRRAQRLRPAWPSGEADGAQRGPHARHDVDRRQGVQGHPARVGRRPAHVVHDGAGRPRAAGRVQQPHGVVVLEPARRAPHPVLGHDVDEPHRVDDLAGLLGHLADDAPRSAPRPGRARPRAGSTGPAPRCGGASWVSSSRSSATTTAYAATRWWGTSRRPLGLGEPGPSGPDAGGSAPVSAGCTAYRRVRSPSTPSTPDDRARPASRGQARRRVLPVPEREARDDPALVAADDGDHRDGHPRPAVLGERRGERRRGQSCAGGVASR